MTVPLHGSPVDPAVARDQDLVLARLHLRLGSLGLARAELEGMAGAGTLDDEALVDLAEARWRTGDLAGAGEAAGVALAAGSESIVAYVIAAEATAAVGRPSEAGRLASRALELANMSVTEIFAGMPRASVWPPELFDAATTEPLLGLSSNGSALVGGTAVTLSTVPATRGLWDDDVPAVPDLPDPAAALESGRTALAAGDPGTAALHLALAVRLGPTLAPAVLDLLEGVDGPELALVRGDAYRLVGHERDARLAYAGVAAAIPDPDPDPPDKETT
jgi:hypothetical protein